jgi:hypothetical protein
MSHGSLLVQFVPSSKLDPAKPRLSLCTVKRRDVSALLKQVCYKSVADNPSDAAKVFKVTVSDGLPHTSSCCVELNIDPIDDATEMQRLNNQARKFRSASAEDAAGFRLFDDVTLFDPDTFAFNGAILRVELVGGGDPRHDHVALLTEQQQGEYAIVDRRRLRYSEELDCIFQGDRRIASLVMEPASAGSPAFVSITFASYPGDRALPRTFDALEGDAAAVTILDVEACLHAVCFTNIAATVRPGTRIYQAHLHVHGIDSRIKQSIEVLPPLALSPSYGAELQYREGQPPAFLFGKLALSVSDKLVFKKGGVAVRVSAECEPRHDVLSPIFTKSSPFSIVKNSVYYNKEYMGALADGLPPHQLQLAFDWASKCTAKHLQAFLRIVAFSNSSDDPSTARRTVELAITLPTEDSTFTLTTSVAVISSDDPTEIELSQGRVEAIREGPAVSICGGCTVVDPDTVLFQEPDWLTVQIKSAADESDVLGYFGVDLDGPPAARELRADGGARLMAVVEPSADHLHSGFTVLLKACSLEELQDIVQNISFEAKVDLRGRSANKKQIVVALQTGAAPTFRTIVAVDVLPMVAELPAMSLRSGVTFKASPTELFPAAAVSALHMEKGAVVTVRVVDAEATGNTLSLELLPRYGVAVKDSVTATNSSAASFSKSRGSFATLGAAEAARPIVTVDNRRVGVLLSQPLGGLSAVSEVSIEITAEKSAAAIQKVIRSVAVSSFGVFRDDVEVELVVTDTARQLECQQSICLTSPESPMRARASRRRSSVSSTTARPSFRKINSVTTLGNRPSNQSIQPKTKKVPVPTPPPKPARQNITTGQKPPPAS